KVAVAEDGRVLDVRQVACPLWQGLDKLAGAFSELRPLLARAQRFNVTMTGELSDLFPDRATGGATLLDYAEQELGSGTSWWMGSRGFGSASAARANPVDVGSTNFLAAATLVACKLSDAVLIDFGSTTTDVIPIRRGAASPRGLTDGER